MARIPVERERRGSPWWLWLIGLLVIAGIAWQLVEMFNNDHLEGNGTVEGVEQTQPVPPPAGADVDNTGTITDAAALFAMSDPGRLVGRDVLLDSMRVDRVIGDSLFVVSHAPGTNAMGQAVTPDQSVDDANLDTAMGGTMMMGRHIVVALARDRSMPPAESSGAVDFSEGQTVSIQGRVAQADAAMMQQWNLDESYSDIPQSGTYIQATSIQADTTMSGQSGR